MPATEQIFALADAADEALDKDTYDQIKAADFDMPDDAEVSIRAGTMRKINALIAALDKAQRDAAPAQPKPVEPPPPVDRTQRQLSGGGEVTPDHREIKPNGQQKGYIVLTAAERAKGFVRPVRSGYVHLKCGTLTTMSRDIAETYARDPFFYSGTFCCSCGKHFPVGEDGEFTWDGTDEKVGT